MCLPTLALGRDETILEYQRTTKYCEPASLAKEKGKKKEKGKPKKMTADGDGTGVVLPNMGRASHMGMLARPG